MARVGSFATLLDTIVEGGAWASGFLSTECLSALSIMLAFASSLGGGGCRSRSRAGGGAEARSSHSFPYCSF